MVTKQEIIIPVLGVLLFTGAVNAGETKQAYETRPDKNVSSPTILPNEFAGELRTGNTYSVKNSEKPRQSKVDLTKAMIGKFRINGI